MFDAICLVKRFLNVIHVSKFPLNVGNYKGFSFIFAVEWVGSITSISWSLIKVCPYLLSFSNEVSLWSSSSVYCTVSKYASLSLSQWTSNHFFFINAADFELMFTLLISWIISSSLVSREKNFLSDLTKSEVVGGRGGGWFGGKSYVCEVSKVYRCSSSLFPTSASVLPWFVPPFSPWFEVPALTFANLWLNSFNNALKISVITSKYLLSKYFFVFSSFEKLRRTACRLSKALYTPHKFFRYVSGNIR